MCLQDATGPHPPGQPHAADSISKLVLLKLMMILYMRSFLISGKQFADKNKRCCEKAT